MLYPQNLQHFLAFEITDLLKSTAISRNYEILDVEGNAASFCDAVLIDLIEHPIWRYSVIAGSVITHPTAVISN
jgi:hypothetical protein